MSKWFGSSLTKNIHIKNQKWYVLDCFKRLSFFFIKKGKKKIINKNFKKLIFFQSKNEDFWNIIYFSLIKNTPLFHLKNTSKKKKNIGNMFKVIPLKFFEQQKIGNFWFKEIILKNLDNTFYLKLKNELINISKDRSKLIEKKKELYENVYKKWEKIIKKKNFKIYNKKRFFSTKVKKNEISIKLKSFNLSHLFKICKEVFNECRFNNMTFTNFNLLPKKRKLYTILKSPHVNKTARDQFELKSYSIYFKIFFEKEEDISFLLQYLKRNTLGIEIFYKIKT